MFVSKQAIMGLELNTLDPLLFPSSQHHALLVKIHCMVPTVVPETGPFLP